MLTMLTFIASPAEAGHSVRGRLWKASPALTAAGLLMLPLLALFGAGLWLDPRLVTGAPAWLKPAKFAASIAIYTLTLAWIFTYLPAWVRTRRIVGRITAAVLVLEIAVIAAQAWRGVGSHFNVATPLDGALFNVMGAAIVVQTLASIWVAAALWRQAFEDRALGWALRLGLTFTIVGAASGGLMAPPTEAQLAAARSGQALIVSGAHTVGAADGGPGLPGTGWSLEHGDLRVPHFVGLHAVQALAVLALLLPAAWAAERRVRLALAGAASYAALFVLLLTAALRGEPLAAPSMGTATALGAWALISAGLAWWLGASSRYPRTSGSLSRQITLSMK